MSRILGVALAGALVWCLAGGQAFAQRGGGGGGRGGGGGHGGGHSGGHSGGGGHGGGHSGGSFHSGSHHSGNFNHGNFRFYGGFYYPFYGYGLYGYGRYGAGYGGYGAGYGYNSYYYDPNYYPVPYPPDNGPLVSGAPGNEAQIVVTLPDPDGEVWFDGRKTRQNGAMRTFVSPPLDGKYSYQISAAWHAGGKLITQERMVNVAPGARVAVDFNPERLPAPKE
jgi:uncharacterized protein (TIGR03000 family)